MAASITGTATSTVRFARTPDIGFFASRPNEYLDTLASLFRTTGTAADQVDQLYVKRHTFAANAAQVINLSAAVGDDMVTSNFARVRYLAVKHLGSADASSLTIDNNGQVANPFVGFLNATGTYKIYPSTLDAAGGAKNNGYHVSCAPGTTAAAVGTGVNVRLLPSAHAFDAIVIVAGASA